MRINNHQKGVGLVEVLVALLILAIGVLGFIALQYRAVEATSESGSRVQAINLARDLAERIRLNRGAAANYERQLTVPANQLTSTKNCFTDADCTEADFADFDVAQITTRARAIGMTVNYLDCQGNVDGRKCIYVAWGDTSATNGTDTDSCTTGTAYNPASTCLIMEVY